MAALTSATCVMITSLLALSLAAEDLESVTATPGQDPVLRCTYPNQAAITKLVWRRYEPKTDDYVLFIRENRPYERYQNPSFVNRAELKHPDMTGGDFSITIKKVTINDTGLYECLVSATNGGRSKRAVVFRQSVSLKVEESGLTPENNDEGGLSPGDVRLRTAAAVSMVVMGVVLGVLVIGFVIHRKQKVQRENVSYEPADKDSDPQQP